jgi:thioredoxin-related protein
LCCSSAFAKGVNFINADWKEILKTAKEKNKYIYVDCFTDWCGWCKVMDKQTFTDKTVGNFMNTNFIAVRYDMEKDFGLKLAMKYRVNVYPSSLIFNPDGKLVYVLHGFQKPADFLITLKKSLDKANQLDLKGVSDSLDLPYPTFYNYSFMKGDDRSWPVPDKVGRYLNKETDIFSEVNWCLIYRFSLPKIWEDFFLLNINKFKDLYGEPDVNDKINSIIFDHFQEAVKDTDESKLNTVKDLIDKYQAEKADEIKMYYELMFYEQTKGWDKFCKKLEEYINKNDYKNTGLINEYCWKIYQCVDNPDYIKKAAGWMKNVTAKDPVYANLDTYAALLYKDKQYKEAELYAKKAITAGKKTKDDIKGTEQLLEKIKKEKGK